MKYNSAPPVRVDCLFTISGNHAWLSGVYPIHVVRKATSHYLAGFQYMPRFKKM